MEEYRRNARMIGIMEQVATVDELQSLRREMRELANLRSSRAIARWQAEGLVDPTLDASLVASALGSMVDRSFYVWFVLGEPIDVEIALDTLNVLCIRALGAGALAGACDRAVAPTGRERSGRRPAAADEGACGRQIEALQLRQLTRASTPPIQSGGCRGRELW